MPTTMHKKLSSTPQHANRADATKLLLSTDFLRSMVSFARRRLADDASAQDAVQETILALLRGHSDFRGESSFTNYAFAVLRHKVVDIIRERVRFVRPAWIHQDENEIESSDPSAAPPASIYATPVAIDKESHIDTIALKRALSLALQSLSYRSCQIIILREWFGFGLDEISRRFDITPGNASVILNRAKQQLRVSLSGQGYGPQIRNEVQHV